MSGEGSGLAQRLVTAAAKAITQVPSATWSTDAQAATVAVLRELARDGHEDMRSWQPVDLEFLADSLEGKPQ